MSNYNVGIIGYGWAASAHIDAINGTTQGQVTAVYSSRGLDPADLKKTHGCDIKVYNKVEDLLADKDIDIVDITSFPNQHKDQAIAAAEAGKNVILEKPITLSLADAQAVKAAFDKNGTKTCVCFEIRFISQFLTTKSIIESGLLGELHYGEADYYHGIGPWYGQFRWNTTKENGGSSLLSAGCHAMDALLFCLGNDVEEVTSYATFSKNETMAKYEYPTTSTTILKFADGKIGKCASVIDCYMPYYFHTHLVGSEGSLLDNKIYSTKLGLRDKAWAELPMAMADSGDVADHPYQAQFQAFFDSIDAGEARMPKTSYDEAFKSFEVIFAADISAEEGRPVKLAEL